MGRHIPRRGLPLIGRPEAGRATSNSVKMLLARRGNPACTLSRDPGGLLSQSPLCGALVHYFLFLREESFGHLFPQVHHELPAFSSDRAESERRPHLGEKMLITPALEVILTCLREGVGESTLDHQDDWLEPTLDVLSIQ